FGNKPTKITDIENLRIKETDRIEALKTELSKFNLAKIKTGKNFIEIIPKSKLRHGNKNNHKIIISTYNDHRIAMAFGILKTKFKNLKIENPKCVSKSYPTFWSDLKKLT
ncbi:3-phosphoshikimate 1-carboxyvinyltransferase, partial [Candidatus Peregrinibacteria bacterium]|nr:3-phosphoshikimate 1-carboxyvinyltransferase [Candidatus Peregrinibacteria bacterium]